MAITKIGTPELFDFSATNTALQLPAGDTASRPTSPSTGEWRYNTDDNYVEYYDGAAWFQIEDEAIPGPVPVGSENFNVNTYFGNGATQTIDAKFNEAANFNGSSSFITLPNSSLISQINDFTISFWIKPDRLSSTGYSTIATFYSNYRNYVDITTGGVLGFKTTTNQLNSSSGAITNGVWQHVALTKSSSAGTVIYVNGAIKGSDLNDTGNADIFSGYGNFVGAYKLTGAGSDFFPGSIDQVRIYNSALDQAAVTALQLETTTTASSLSFPSGETATATYQLDGNGNGVAGNYSATSTTDIGYTGLKFQPDFVWVKQMSSPVRGHILSNSISSVNITNSLALMSTQNDEREYTGTEAGGSYIRSLDSNGFSVGNSLFTGASGLEYVAWNWYAPTAETNQNGSVNSTIKKNVDAGFSIATFTSNASTITVGHGLDSIPDLIIVKATSFADSWFVNCVGLTNQSNRALRLNATSAEETNSAFWNNLGPTSTTFSLGTGISVSGASYVAYSFVNVIGYQKIGSYPGNNSTDGPEIVTGFRPAFVMFKATTAFGGNTFWVILDNKRDGTNTKRLYANSDSAEDTAEQVDFLSNSFKIRTNNSDINGNFSYIYLAIAS